MFLQFYFFDLTKKQHIGCGTVILKYREVVSKKKKNPINIL